MLRLLTPETVSSLIKSTNRHSTAATMNSRKPKSLVDIKSRMWMPRKLTPISRYPSHAPSCST